METFINENIQSGSMIATDSCSSYPAIVKEQFHVPTNQSKIDKENDNLYGAHLIASLAKRLILGTFQGRFEPKYLQNYLDELNNNTR